MGGADDGGHGSGEMGMYDNGDGYNEDGLQYDEYGGMLM